MNGSAFQQIKEASHQLNNAALLDRSWAKYRAALRQGWLQRMKAKVLGQCRCLLALPHISELFYAGTTAVALDQIRGSENRLTDFDIDFYPLSENTGQRWVNIATLMMQDKPLPPVELIQVGQVYYVRDGHHRVSAAKALGFSHIDAAVMVATSL